MDPRQHRRPILAALVLAVLAFLATACENTAEGIREDTRENVDELDQELEEAEEEGAS